LSTGAFVGAALLGGWSRREPRPRRWQPDSDETITVEIKRIELRCGVSVI